MLKIRSRHLPHWVMDDAHYLVTFHLASVVFTESEQLMILEHIKAGHGEFYKLVAVQVMPNHVHLILSPLGIYSLSRIMKGIKGASARLINKHRNTRGSIWMQESFDRIIRDERELSQKLRYMFENPIRAGFVEDGNTYPGWFFNEDTLQGRKQ